MTFVNEWILLPSANLMSENDLMMAQMLFVVVNIHEREWKDMSSHSPTLLRDRNRGKVRWPMLRICVSLRGGIHLDEVYNITIYVKSRAGTIRGLYIFSTSPYPLWRFLAISSAVDLILTSRDG